MRFPDVFRTKSLDTLVAETQHADKQLRRTLGPLQLTFLGIGAIIGAGIFSSVGSAAAGSSDRLGAGPALVISFVVVAIACGFAALCYAEFASMVPVSGSAYTYAYATLGELIAWIIGWDLILEYAVGNVAVAIGWSGYFQELLRGFSIEWPLWLGIDYRTASQAAAEVAQAKAASVDLTSLGVSVTRAAAALDAAPRIWGIPILFNVPAALIVLFITAVLVRGIRESARLNSSMVILKLAIIIFFLAFGAFYVRPENWSPFAPNGWAGISAAAAIIFFAYIGFDAVSTASEEARNPQRDMPIGMIASLIVCTLIYIGVAVVLTGMLNYTKLGTAEPLATAFSERGLNWTAAVISFGAVFATTSVLLVFQIGQPRILFSMARDGLLPQWAASVHKRFRTPHVTTILSGVVVATFAGVTNINEVIDLCNIGTLFAFIIVAAGIIVLRIKDPQRQRPFRAPLFPFVPIGAILSCGFLMTRLPLVTWIRFVVWLGIGLAIYIAYGFARSLLSEGNGNRRGLT
jgi:basic amino acid/polyamine antiporter, APA family